MFHKLQVFLLLFLLSGAAASAQPLAVYTSMQQQVTVWDNGILRKIDYMAPTIIQTGRVAIPYLDNSRSFKIYYGGGLHPINNGYTNTFRATDNLVTFLNAKSLNVFEDGKIKNLSLLCDDYYVGDSIVLFLDGVHNEYRAYYDGEIFPIENFLAAQGVAEAKVSDNIAAYDNYARQFRIFYHGVIIPQEEYEISSFGVGRNTVAYVDANRSFKVFQNGETRTIDDFSPIDYQVGDNLVAYRSNDGYFRIYYNDSLYNVGFFNPDYVVGDNIVAFRDAGNFLRIFYKGEFTTLDNFYPQSFSVQYNSLVYMSQSNTLRMFSEGEVYDVTSAPIEEWDLNYDVLKYRIGEGLYKIFYKGREY